MVAGTERASIADRPRSGTGKETFWAARHSRSKSPAQQAVRRHQLQCHGGEKTCSNRKLFGHEKKAGLRGAQRGSQKGLFRNG